ncbi:MAG: hypothetical protein IJU18_02535 [Oscillospiraceae bacterium]|nr:hypothetical protein [Oscillospiraceae bacterium]
MENHIAQQWTLLILSALTGLCAALVYDVTGAVRRRCRRRWLTHLLDGAYALALLASLAVFARRWGDGELRLFTVPGLLGGAGLYSLLPTAWRHPLWDFWVDTVAALVRLLLLPSRFLFQLLKKFFRFAKKHFHFFNQYAKIKKYRWDFILVHRRGGYWGGHHNREKREKGKKRQ